MTCAYSGQAQKLTTTDPYTGDEIVGLNSWRGFLVRPWSEPADIEAGVARAEHYFADTVRGMFGDDYAAYLLKLIAHAIQRPEDRFAQFIYVWGHGGTGKNFLSTALRQLYGPIHFVTFTTEQYSNKFNASKVSAAWAFVNEVPSSLSQVMAVTMASELKEDADPNSISRGLEKKHQDKVTVDRNCKVLIASQFPPPFVVDDGLRRRMVLLRTDDSMAKHDGTSPWGRKEHAWWAERWDWLNSHVGARDVMTFLGRLNTEGFKATDDALQTQWLVGLLEAQGTRTFPEFVLSMKRDLSRVLEDAGIADRLTEKVVALDAVRYLDATMAVTLYKRLNPDSPITGVQAGRELTGQALQQRRLQLAAKSSPDGKYRSGWFYDLRPDEREPNAADAFADIDKLAGVLGLPRAKY